MQDAYQHQCTHHHGANNLAADNDDAIATMLAKLVNQVYNKKGIPTKLHSGLVIHYANTLWDGLAKGYGQMHTDVDFTTPDAVMLQKMQDSIWHFSAAKNFSQLRALSAALIDETGKLRSFEQFRTAAHSINNEHVNAWLKAEYNLAVAGGQMAATWVRAEANKDVLPFLKYVTAGDERVRQAHADLDGVVRPIDDDFWNIYYPPNGYNCRCDVIQVGAGYRVTPVDKILPPANMPAMFKTNLAKKGLAFPANHPYFIGNAPVVKETAAALQQKHGIADVELLKESIKNKFSTGMNVKVTDVVFNDDVDLQHYTAMSNKVSELLDEYKPATVYGYSKPVVHFKSTSTTFGSVATYNDGTILTKINFGHRSDGVSRTMQRVTEKEGFTTYKHRLYAAKSKCDEQHLPLATVVHEFAHVMTIRQQRERIKLDDRLLPFWNEVDKLKRKYSREIKPLMRIVPNDPNFSKNTNLLNEIYLGDYASTNANEFMAEAFTEYKLSSNPTKYAKLVGVLVDKYFKR